MTEKEITVVFYERRFPRDEWRYDVDDRLLQEFFARLEQELTPFGIQVKKLQDPDLSIDVNGYGDLLNSVRIRSPKDSIGNLCLGHIIGASPSRDLFEDIRRGVNRVAFAPETVEPEGSNKVVCHNCGCGC